MGCKKIPHELNIVERPERQGAYIVVTFAANGRFSLLLSIDIGP